jgi:hypothetical protein
MCVPAYFVLLEMGVRVCAAGWMDDERKRRAEASLPPAKRTLLQMQQQLQQSTSHEDIVLPVATPTPEALKAPITCQVCCP